MSKKRPASFERAKEEFYRENKGKIKCAGESLVSRIKCYGVMTIHHMKGRDGELLTDKRYFMFLCRKHHDWVHSHEPKAYRLGMIIK